VTDDKKLKLSYVGEDSKTFADIAKALAKTLSVDGIELETIPFDAPKNSGIKQFTKIWDNPPQLLLLDFANYDNSANTKERFEAMLNLATYIRSDWKTKKITTVALHDLLTLPLTIKKVLLSGVRFNHIKSSETLQALEQIISRVVDNRSKYPTFALAKENREVELFQDIVISYLEKNYIRVETNVPLPVGGLVELTDHPYKQDIRLLKAHVESAKEGALFYNYRFAYHLNINQTLSEMAASFNLEKKFNQLKNNITPKWVRVFVVDPQLEFLRRKMPNLDSFPFSIKFQSNFDDALEKIEKFLPQIIAIQNVPDEQIAKLKSLIQRCQNFHPHLLHFKIKKGEDNSSNETELKTNAPLEWSTLEKIHSLYARKGNMEGMERIFFRQSYPEAVAVIKRSIKIVAYTEDGVFFHCEDELHAWTVFRITYPIDCLITIIHPPQDMTGEDIKDCYYGVFNNFTEQAKKQIRQHINEVFTKDRKAAELKEREEFYQLNQKTAEARDQQKAEAQAQADAQAAQEKMAAEKKSK